MLLRSNKADVMTLSSRSVLSESGLRCAGRLRRTIAIEALILVTTDGVSSSIIQTQEVIVRVERTKVRKDATEADNYSRGFTFSRRNLTMFSVEVPGRNTSATPCAFSLATSS